MNHVNHVTGETVATWTAAQYWIRVDARRMWKRARRSMWRDVRCARFMKRAPRDDVDALALMRLRMYRIAERAGREVARG